MKSFISSGVVLLAITTMIAACASNLDKALNDPNTPVGSIITVDGQTYKKLGPGHGVSCTAPCE